MQGNDDTGLSDDESDLRESGLSHLLVMCPSLNVSNLQFPFGEGVKIVFVS